MYSRQYCLIRYTEFLSISYIFQVEKVYLLNTDYGEQELLCMKQSIITARCSGVTSAGLNNLLHVVTLNSKIVLSELVLWRKGYWITSYHHFVQSLRRICGFWSPSQSSLQCSLTSSFCIIRSKRERRSYSPYSLFLCPVEIKQNFWKVHSYYQQKFCETVSCWRPCKLSI